MKEFPFARHRSIGWPTNGISIKELTVVVKRSLLFKIKTVPAGLLFLPVSGD